MRSTHTRYAAITATDLLLVSWLIYCALRNIWSTGGISNMTPYLFVFSCYVAARFFRRYVSLLWGISIVGIWQSVLALMQHIGWIASRHQLFNVTGSFGNPGQLGGLLAVSMVCMVCLVMQRRKGRVYLFSLFLLQAYALWLSDSRAGWIAAFCGGLFLLWNRPLGAWPKFRTSLPVKIILCILGAVFLWGLYCYKPDSANGRMLVWRVSADMIADKPLLGHGIGGFNRNYMHYQAAYFEKHPDSAYQQYADNVQYAYNEFLHIWVDQGAIGLILFIVLIGGALLVPAERNIYKGPLIAYLAVALFSYPSYVPGLLALFPILLAAIQSRPLSVHISKGVYWGFVAAALCCAGYVGKEYVFRKQCRVTIQDLFSSSAPKAAEAKKFAADHYQRLLAYPRIADVYAQYTFRHYDPQEALVILSDVKKVVPTSELYCDLGDLHKALGDFDSARDCYQTAGNMIPRRLTPKYKLFVLFRDMGDTLSARHQASEILSMPIRLEGTRTLKMKAEVRQFMTTPQ